MKQLRTDIRPRSKKVAGNLPASGRTRKSKNIILDGLAPKHNQHFWTGNSAQHRDWLNVIAE
jgi:hypothetical protein